ncbi:MAG: hypothetical protein LBM96_07575 [Methanobrevibacter sp.]|jgi:hypothetical protein|nr:hypothetical protein [Candidatus Methanoflexus mossambicus]
MEDKVLESYFLDMKSEFKIVNHNIGCLNSKVNQLDEKIDKLNLDLNKRMDYLDDNQKILSNDMKEIKENHLHHIELDINSLKNNEKWVRYGIITIALGIFLLLTLQSLFIQSIF